MFKIVTGHRPTLLCIRKDGFKMLRHAKAQGFPAALYKRRNDGTWREVAEVTPW